MASDHIKELLSQMPNSPGIYRFLDESGKILYVGKAKNLKRRTSSYFNKKHDSARLNMLVRRIKNIEVTLVSSEQEALLLENSMIKKFQPKYNVQLKDDKTYPFICIKNERFPRVFLTRQYVADGSLYLGPYTSVRSARTILEMLRNIFQLRTCNLDLQEDKIHANKFKVCLEYHIKNCAGPCEGLQSEEDYNESIDQIKKILRGQSNQVLVELKERMKQYAESYEFEKANDVKQKVDILTNYNARTAVVNPSITNVDVFSIAEAEDHAFINYFKIVNGSIIQTKSLELQKQLDETTEDLLLIAITEIREQLKSTAREIYLPIEMEVPIDEVKVTVPLIGDKKRLMELSYKNAMFLKSKFLESREAKAQKKNISYTLQQLKEDLRLKEIPYHIECFDNSNFQGSQPVASMVVFKNAKPSKKDYRHFNIKTVVGPDDFASMREIVSRRYKRLLEENEPLPQLIVIDGGKGQLSAAVDALKDVGAFGKVAVVSIAKKLEEIYYPGDPLPLHISKRSQSLKIIQQLRNEAHRFAITFHRSKRDKATLRTGLTDIKGIGEKVSQALLAHFKSEQKIRQASQRELASIIGQAKARLIYDHYHSDQ